jgi:hypothetical protein
MLEKVMKKPPGKNFQADLTSRKNYRIQGEAAAA